MSNNRYFSNNLENNFSFPIGPTNLAIIQLSEDVENYGNGLIYYKSTEEIFLKILRIFPQPWLSDSKGSLNLLVQLRLSICLAKIYFRLSGNNCNGVTKGHLIVWRGRKTSTLKKSLLDRPRLIQRQIPVSEKDSIAKKIKSSDEINHHLESYLKFSINDLKGQK